MALLAVEDALEMVLADVAARPAESLALSEAHLRVLAQDLAAKRDVPDADVSAMDGYALRGADVGTVPARLAVIGEAAAGHPAGERVGPGQAMRIFTGGVVPAGADTVVIQENTTREGDVVIVQEAARPGQNVRPRGGDFRTGAVLLHAGARLSDRDLSLAATMNHANVPVFRRPRVALLATGDELVAPGAELAPGAVIHSNVYALAALIRAEGGVAIDHGIARDTLEATRAAIRAATQGDAADTPTDILVTTGGASVGDHDYVGRALEAEGFVMSFLKVAMKPGQPVMFGRRGALRVIGLPGNPVSSYVGAVLFLRPLIRAMSGRADARPALEPALLAAPVKANGGRQDYMRARLGHDEAGRLIATPVSRQDSSMLAPLSAADAMIVRPPNAPAAEAGAPCAILKLPF